jgi:hypothetical protein
MLCTTVRVATGRRSDHFEIGCENGAGLSRKEGRSEPKHFQDGRRVCPLRLDLMIVDGSTAWSIPKHQSPRIPLNWRRQSNPSEPGQPWVGMRYEASEAKNKYDVPGENRYFYPCKDAKGLFTFLANGCEKGIR